MQGRKRGKKEEKKKTSWLSSWEEGRVVNIIRNKEITPGSSEGAFSVPFLRYMDSGQSLEQI